MKKKLAMRIASLALCVVFVGALFGVPKAKAVAVEAAAVSIGVAVLGSYLIATNMDVIGDTAETISNGISSLVSDWVTASGVADSGDSWLSSLGTAVSVRNPGVLIVPGALAAGCAAFVSWLTETFELDEDGDGSIVVEGTAEFYRYGSLTLPSLVPIWNQVLYPYALIGRNSSDDQIYVIFSSYEFVNLGYPSYNIAFGASVPVCPVVKYVCVNNQWKLDESTTTGQLYGNSELKWCSPMIYYLNGAAAYNSSVLETVPVGDAVVGQIELLRQQGYSNVAEGALDDDELAITTGLTAATLAALANDVPAKIAAGTLAPTAELTQTGEGTEDEDVLGADGTTVGLLQSILEKIKVIPDAIAKGVADVFTPSQEAVDSLSAEVDAKLPFIPTLRGFGDDLVYNLEHPEECADGLGLTTVVDLGKGRGTYLGNTKHELLDVSWYLEYKPLVDDIIVGFCWLCFLWNCYGALPKIIHGEGSTITVNSLEFPTVGAGWGKKELGDDK